MTILASKTKAYARLAKLDIVDYYLSALVVWTMLAPAARFDGGNLLTLTIFLLSEICLVVALVAFDDVTGYRDGSDTFNYRPDAPARRMVRKPLVAGTLTEAEAVRFGWATTGIGALLWAVSIAIAPHHPIWVIMVAVVYLVLVIQYSWGLKISYHGGQEAFIAGLGVVLMLIPYGLLTGELPGFALAQSLLFGLGPLLFGVYSNINDIEGDRLVNRPTVATSTSPRGNAIFIGALSCAELALVVAPAAAGWAPRWFPLIMFPVVALRARQLVIGLRGGEILRARKLGIWIHRLSFVLLVAANLLAGGVS